MKTGFYIRFGRDGKWQNLDIADLTNEEFELFLQSHTSIQVQDWALALHLWIINNVIFEEGESRV